jgi:hypothetical protein
MIHYCQSFGEFQVAGQEIRIDYGFMIIVIMMPVYMMVDFLTGFMQSLFFIVQLYLSNYLWTNKTLGENHWEFMVGLHIFAWIL